MSKYIDAKYIKTLMKGNNLMQGNCEYELWKQTVDKVVDNMPAIDIVRCKNCRYRKMKKATFRGEPLIYYRCELLEREVEDDEFCSWGDEK